jgi:hypothetical protein
VTWGSLPQPGGQLGGGGRFQLGGEGGDPGGAHCEHGPEDFQAREQPAGQERFGRAPALLSPPALRGGLAVGEEQAAALGLQLGAGADEGFALPVDVPLLFLRLGGYADDGQFLFVPIDIAREPLAEHARVERVGLHPLARPRRACAGR